MEEEALRNPEYRFDASFDVSESNVADTNHMDFDSTNQPFVAFHEWPVEERATSKRLAFCSEEEDRTRRSDSFSDEWQDYTSDVSSSVAPELSGLPGDGSNLHTVNFTSMSRTILSECFHTKTLSRHISYEEKFNYSDDLFWKQLSDSVVPTSFNWSCDQAKDHVMTSLEDRLKPISRCSSPRVSISPDSESSFFDWSEDAVCPMLLELRMGNLDLESTNYVYSMQVSPVELEFDHNQAALGLSVLSTEELNEMHMEMAEKFSRLSDMLIQELQKRDILVRDHEVRNQFVASLMKVEGKKKAVSQAKANAAANPTSSSKRLALKAKNTLRKKSSTNDLVNQCKFLGTVIPYLQPPNGEWKTQTLQLLTKLLDAVHEDSPTLAGLTTDYLSSEVFNLIPDSSTDSNNIT